MSAFRLLTVDPCRSLFLPPLLAAQLLFWVILEQDGAAVDNFASLLGMPPVLYTIVMQNNKIIFRFQSTMGSNTVFRDELSAGPSTVIDWIGIRSAMPI